MTAVFVAGSAAVAVLFGGLIVAQLRASALPTGGKHHAGHVRIVQPKPAPRPTLLAEMSKARWQRRNPPEDTMPIRIAEVLDALGVGHAKR